MASFDVDPSYLLHDIITCHLILTEVDSIDRQSPLWNSGPRWAFTCGGCSRPARPPRRRRALPFTLTSSSSSACWPREGHPHAVGAHGPRVRLGGAGRTCSPSHLHRHVGPVRVIHMPWCSWPTRSPRRRRPHQLTIIIGMLTL